MNTERKKTRIAFFIETLNGGGAERTVSNLSMQLARTFDVFVIVMDGRRITYPYGGKLIDLKDTKEKTRIWRLRKWKLTRRLRKTLRENEIGCVLSFMRVANRWSLSIRGAGLIRRGKGKDPCARIASVRNYPFGENGSETVLREECLELSRADAIAAISEGVAQLYRERPELKGKRIVSILNPCDRDRIRKLAAMPCEYRFDPECFYFITAGRLVKQKGQWHLLKAFAALFKEDPSVRLVILGEGELGKELAVLAQELGIENAVHFAGYVEDPFAYIARADCFVFPSLHEGLGNGILEAMACRVPVIASDCLAGPREILCMDGAPEYGKPCTGRLSGILISPPDGSMDLSTAEDAFDVRLYKEMKRLRNDPELADSLRHRGWDRLAEFSPEKIGAQWIQLIEQTVIAQ